MDIRGPLWDKVAGPWSWSLTPI